MTFQQIYDQAIHQSIYDQYLEILKPLVDSSTRLLDVGCGTGRLLSMFQSTSSYLYGLDNDIGMIDFAKTKYPYIQFQLHDMHETFPFYADIILLSMDVIHFSKTPFKVLAHAMDALDDEGVIIFDYFTKPLKKVEEQHHHPLTYTWKRTILENEVHHQIVFQDTMLHFKQYLHFNLDFKAYFIEHGFQVFQVPSIDPNKKIIVAKR
jgi:SAM-dependent methyltransferase